MRDGRVLQVATPKELYERPTTRFVADFVGTNNFIAGVCRGMTGEQVLVDTPLGALRGRATSLVSANGRCVLAVRPENITIGGADENAVDGTVILASYLGSVLRYDVATATGFVLKADIRDPWHHVLLGTGQAVRLTFPSSAALTLPDE
jgi:ABC-type Fe3+/spermidine/putrescine transport system ATPase subunit